MQFFELLPCADNVIRFFEEGRKKVCCSAGSVGANEVRVSSVFHWQRCPELCHSPFTGRSPQSYRVVFFKKEYTSGFDQQWSEKNLFGGNASDLFEVLWKCSWWHRKGSGR